MKPLHIVFIVLLLVVWVVMLAGVAAYHDNLSNFTDKDEYMRQFWWGVWFEFFLLVLNVVALVMGADEWHLVLIAFAAMASAYLMNHAEFWLTRVDAHSNNGDLEDSANAAAAGTIMVIIVNWILIILMGNENFRSMVSNKAEAAAGAVTGPDA